MPSLGCGKCPDLGFRVDRTIVPAQSLSLGLGKEAAPSAFLFRPLKFHCHNLIYVFLFLFLFFKKKDKDLFVGLFSVLATWTSQRRQGHACQGSWSTCSLHSPVCHGHLLLAVHLNIYLCATFSQYKLLRRDHMLWTFICAHPAPVLWLPPNLLLYMSPL